MNQEFEKPYAILRTTFSGDKTWKDIVTILRTTAELLHYIKGISEIAGVPSDNIQLDGFRFNKNGLTIQYEMLEIPNEPFMSVKDSFKNFII